MHYKWHLTPVGLPCVWSSKQLNSLMSFKNGGEIMTNLGITIKCTVAKAVLEQINTNIEDKASSCFWNYSSKAIIS